eukprot:scaffold300754_cov60-Attheya_sp.AAC.2
MNYTIINNNIPRTMGVHETSSRGTVIVVSMEFSFFALTSGDSCVTCPMASSVTVRRLVYATAQVSGRGKSMTWRFRPCFGVTIHQRRPDLLLRAS